MHDVGRKTSCHSDRSGAERAKWRNLLLLAASARYVHLLLLSATILALAAPLAAKSWRVSNFQDTITVNPDGSALVNETITLNFVGEWHGIHRTIPIEYPGPNGTNYQLFVNVTSVTDENGAKLKYDSSTSGAYRDLKIYIPNAVDATRTVEIAYRVRNGTRFFDGSTTSFIGTSPATTGPCPSTTPRPACTSLRPPANLCVRKPSPASTARPSTMQPRTSNGV